jgi:hypothetical protein
LPDSALTGCMSFLDVTSALALGAQVGGLDPEHLATATARLAAAFGLDEIQLRDQLSFWRPRALNLAKQHGLQTSQDAWQMLLQKEEKNSHTPYGMNALREALEQSFGSGLVTSQLESSFSIHRKEWSPQRDGAFADTEAFVTALMLDLPRRGEVPDVPAFDRQLAQKARVVWAHVYPSPRARLAPRVDRGVPRPKRVLEHSESTFIKRRRAAVAPTATSTLLVDSLDVTTFPEWQDGHQKEQQFQQSKQERRKLQAFGEGMLLPSEAAKGDLTGDLAKLHAQQIRDQRKRDQTSATNMLKIHGGLRRIIIQQITARKESPFPERDQSNSEKLCDVNIAGIKCATY